MGNHYTMLNACTDVGNQTAKFSIATIFPFGYPTAEVLA